MIEQSNIIPFPEKKRLTPNEIEVIENDEAHKLVIYFVEAVLMTDEDKRRAAFSIFRQKAFAYSSAFDIGGES